MLRDCPHCYTSVIPKADGTCPSCQQSMLAAACDPTLCSLRIVGGAQLPSVCYLCGGHADREFSIVRRSDGGSEETGNLTIGIIGMFVSLWIALIMWLRREFAKSEVEVVIPVCSDHTENGAPDPRYVDFKNATMTFIVHRKLRDAIRASAPRGDGES